MQKLSILFSASVTLIILHSYTAYISAVLILPVFFCSYLVYRFCDHCYSEKLRARYLLVLALLLVLMLWMLSARIYSVSFVEWLYIDLSYLDYFWYFFAFFVACCFIITSAVFYFTVIIYRSLFLFIVLLIPFGLNFTRLMDVPVLYTVPAIGLYFALMVILGKKELKGAVSQVNNSYAYAFTAAVCLVTSFSFFVDLPENAPSTTEGDGALDGLLGRNYSSGVPDFSQENDEIMFLVEADEQLYFLRQVFINYDGTRWVHESASELNAETSDWEIMAEALNFDRLFELALKADDDGWLSQPLRSRENIERLTNVEQIKTATIIPQGNQAAVYVLAPPRTFSVPGLPHAQNRLGEIFFADWARIVFPYSIDYYSDFFKANHDFRIAAQKSAPDVASLLSELTLFAMNDSELRDTYLDSVISFASRLHDATVFEDSSQEFQSSRIRNLALDITEGLDSDFEKAAAIERSFWENGYSYDAEGAFIEVNQDIEHFIFESRSGTCGHFATAMTLMARSIGLNARYAEGFTSSEINSDGLYVIRARNSHAYVQVHIPLYGWVTFDPTVSRSDDGAGVFGMITELSFLVFVCFSILILLGLAGYLLYTRVIKETLFRHRAAKSSGRSGIILIYGKVLALARQRLNMDNVSSASLSRAVHEKYGLDIIKITTSFERTFFGNESITFQEKNEALEVYKQLWTSSRKVR